VLRTSCGVERGGNNPATTAGCAGGAYYRRAHPNQALSCPYDSSTAVTEESSGAKKLEEMIVVIMEEQASFFLLPFSLILQCNVELRVPGFSMLLLCCPT